jgi:hypothetical protein
MVASPQPDDPGSQLDALTRRIDELERKTLYSASIGEGGLTIRGGYLKMVDDTGTERLFIGESPDSMPPGQTQPVFRVRDSSGNIRLGVYDNSAGYDPVVWIYDDSGHVAFTTDQNGGIAEPWIPIPMYARFIPTNFPNATGTFPTLPASACNGNGIWEGRIGKVSHPYIQFDIVTGRVTGTNAVPTYTFWVNGVQEGTLTTAVLGPNVVGPFDISNLIGFSNVTIEIKVSAVGTGTDLISCAVNGVWMRQT